MGSLPPDTTASEPVRRVFSAPGRPGMFLFNRTSVWPPTAPECFDCSDAYCLFFIKDTFFLGHGMTLLKAPDRAWAAPARAPSVVRNKLRRVQKALPRHIKYFPSLCLLLCRTLDFNQASSSCCSRIASSRSWIQISD